MSIGGFDWDEGNWPKCGKHGLSRSDIEFIFRGDFATFEDPHAATTEKRQRAIGKTSAGRYAFVVFCLRQRNGVTLIRPISARYMHGSEVQRFEQV
ncbi:BrnT family toxin [Rhizobium sp. BG4]|uniref:BrnT family toxin n=1 Tax=Rhizobium sp. BG4 TaxID=2613770 RepID=UPI00193EA718|nr:BrnT family toxin [Rhizobium sp. BG4]QRM44282.1 BrnT family toxin [Rhizobium sp. BG4]